ncbi:hypothetical protein [Aliivibrio sp. SR45-2]|uniref:hypothetical protein n=1 Tax=Aliivibrio sp. SR45-2 TaxID=2760931 RepID=UPI0015FA58D5|nr:hypothetical protein [Aliivibrio sp. SR45-2]MBB1313450.1 hypothetical protein [Aliivibrio sp. SR45-2]
MTTLSLLPHMGSLLNYTSKIAMTIRLNSNYCGKETLDENTSRVSVMWLSDMLHNLHFIGSAMQSNDHLRLSNALEKQHTYWRHHEKNIEQAIHYTHGTTANWSVEEGCAIIKRLQRDIEKGDG